MKTGAVDGAATATVTMMTTRIEAASFKARVGDIVTASGVVHAGKTPGVGYSFSVPIEDARLQQ
ncbi:MAG: hypothetical protein JWP34_1023 [Massilia sp.]|nr:hypothetical protein [Massilia sp.]